MWRVAGSWFAGTVCYTVVLGPLGSIPRPSATIRKGRPGWLRVAVWKAVRREPCEFESHSFRHTLLDDEKRKKHGTVVKLGSQLVCTQQLRVRVPPAPPEYGPEVVRLKFLTPVSKP